MHGHPCMNPASYDAAVVGTGIVGAACADELCRRGMRVLIIGREMIGDGATAAGMGHIVVMDDSEPQFSLTHYSQQKWEKLRPALSPDVEYDACGTIWIAGDEEEMLEVKRKEAYYQERGVTGKVLDAQGLYQLEPNIRPGMLGGLLVPGDSVLYPPCAASFLIRRAQALGATLHLGIAVGSIGNHTIRLINGQEFSASFIVNAAGAYSPDLTAGIPVKKRKGHLVITDRYPGFVKHQLVEFGYLKSAHSVSSDSVAFNVQPRRTGQILIGSSRQYGSEDTKVDNAILVRMLQRAREYMPELGGLSMIRTWTGFRPATPDKLPLIGPSSTDSSVFLATGHEGLGITTSLGTAHILADLIEGKAPEIPSAAFLPSRTLKDYAHA